MTPELQRAIADNVTAALEEDLGTGDLTASLIDADAIVGATIVAREPMVIAGEPWVNEVFSRLDPEIVVDWYIGDGGTADADDVICKLVGSARHLLSGERAALNFLQTLSATATTAATWVAATRGTRATILDTRKTIPGLRQAQKYAVRIGGASNHRTGLFDAILIKENHIRAAGGIAAALKAANASAESVDADVLVEIEVESLDELREALDSGATRVLLDNFSVEDLRAAVEVNAGYGYVAAELEASGNITLDNVREIAETGVDFISTGALTKNVKAADFSMLLSI